jgi:hypothetical protein
MSRPWFAITGGGLPGDPSRAALSHSSARSVQFRRYLEADCQAVGLSSSLEISIIGSVGFNLSQR